MYVFENSCTIRVQCDIKQKKVPKIGTFSLFGAGEGKYGGVYFFIFLCFYVGKCALLCGFLWLFALLC